MVSTFRFARRRAGSARFLVFLTAAGFLGLSSCGDGDSGTNAPVVTPKIISLSDSTLVPGDTLIIQGTDFATPASGNTVTFNNALANVAPFAATSESLAVVVPANANTGPLYVVARGVQSNSVAIEVLRDVGDVWVVGGVASYAFKVPVTTGSERYLVVAESATSSGSSYSFQVTPVASSAYPAPPKAPGAGPVYPARTAASATGEAAADAGIVFESGIRNEALDYLKTYGAGKQAAARRASAGPPAATEQFFVLKCVGCSVFDPSSFAEVTATLQYQGTAALIYADNNQPSNGFTLADYQAFGSHFDSQIYPTNTTAFGPPTDIDANGRIVILFTPVVNDLTADGTAVSQGFISGFTLINDLAPGVFPSGTSNGMEIFYSMVPDPNSEYGNAFPKTVVESVVPGTLAHEFEHMISTGYRYLVLGGGTDPKYIQQTWLEEGMAHMAEDLNNMDGQNILRANRYLREPYKTSLLGNVELRPNNIDTLEQRGGIFLFLRYLGDQLGESIYKTIVQNRAVGIASIENVTHKEFYKSLGDCLAALYLSDRGITSDPTYEYTSFNVQNDFAAVLVTERQAQDGVFSGAVRSATGNYYAIGGAGPPALEVRVSTSSSAKVRVVVVRVQ